MQLYLYDQKCCIAHLESFTWVSQSSVHDPISADSVNSTYHNHVSRAPLSCEHCCKG